MDERPSLVSAVLVVQGISSRHADLREKVNQEWDMHGQLLGF